jgi:hypothetical protein
MVVQQIEGSHGRANLFQPRIMALSDLVQLRVVAVAIDLLSCGFMFQLKVP